MTSVENIHMYVLTYVHTYVDVACVVCMQVSSDTQLHTSNTSVHYKGTRPSHMYTCTHVRTHYTHMHIDIRMYVRTFKTALYISMYVCMYTQTHTHTHAHQLPFGDSQILLHFHVLPSGPSQRNPNHMEKGNTHTNTHTHVHSAHTTWTGWLCTLTTHSQGENELSSAPSTVHTPLCVHSFQTHLANDIPNCVLVDGQVVLR